MTVSVQARSGLSKITPYETGESRIEGINNVIKLSSNESPFGPGPAAVNALNRVWENLSRYPSSDHSELRNAIQEVHGLDADRIVCGAGSDEILGLIAQAFSGSGTEVIYTEHGFLMYPIFARTAGAQPIAVKEHKRRVNVEAILSACNSRTRLVYIANPSNPTGRMMASQDIERLVDSLPANVILVLDGAYAEFVEADDCSVRLANERKNVVITRTFSKIHGLASLRIGYGYGPLEIMEILNRIRGPFNVSGPAQAAAVAAVQDQKHVQHCLNHNSTWRRWLRLNLINSGVKVDESFANFLLARFATPDEAQECDHWLRKEGIIVRRMEKYQLPKCLRISIGSENACRKLANSVAAFKSRQIL